MWKLLFPLRLWIYYSSPLSFKKKSTNPLLLIATRMEWCVYLCMFLHVSANVLFCSEREGEERVFGKRVNVDMLIFTGVWNPQWWLGKICFCLGTNTFEKVPAWCQCWLCFCNCCSGSSCSCSSPSFCLCKCCTLCFSWFQK